jgi:hypothetical protein
LAVLFFNRLVALAGAFAQTVNIKYFDFAAPVLNQSCFLKSARHSAYTGALDPQHFS